MTQLQSRFGVLQIGIILLTIATAAIHTFLAFNWLFYANALGYLGLLGLLYLPIPMVAPYRTYVRWALAAFAAVTVVAWVFMGTRDMLAYFTKVIEIVLIILLIVEGRQSSE